MTHVRARHFATLLGLTLGTVACSSASSYEGVDIALALRIDGSTAPIAMEMNGEALTLERASVGLSDIRLVECPRLAHAPTLLQTLSALILPTAHAHGANTPFSFGTPFALTLRQGDALSYSEARAFYPEEGFAICALLLTFEPVHDDAVFHDSAPELDSARIYAQGTDINFRAKGRDQIEIPLDQATTIQADTAYTLVLTVRDALSGAILQGTSDDDQANALFDAVVAGISAEVSTRETR